MTRFARIALPLIAAVWLQATHADLSLEFVRSSEPGQATTLTLAIARFYARVDDSNEPNRRLLYQAGKYFPLHEINDDTQTYRLLSTRDPKHQSSETPAGKPDEAKATPPIKLQPTKQSRTIAGINCLVITETWDGEAVREHCMANKARLGASEREMRTLARLFSMAREKDLGWMFAATDDEDFVSISTVDLRDQKRIDLKAASTAPLPVGHLRVPDGYRPVEP